MIGVAASPEHREAVKEFFELFKTPWEPVAPGKRYEAVVIADGRSAPQGAPLALVYGVTAHPWDAHLGALPEEVTGVRAIQWQENAIPIYGRVATFTGSHADATLSGGSSYSAQVGVTKVRRFGYDLFHEISMLLTAGQPVEQAEAPTLELHIALVRHCLDAERVAFVEIPPRPAGAEFVCCLTHDIDFFGIRRHLADRTLMGFAWRATAGSMLEVLRGRRSVRSLARNLAAVVSLPFVFAGVADDFWDPFADYARGDRGHASTFFLVPFKNQTSARSDGLVERRRAVAYEAREIARDVRAAAGPQTEFAVHGIDAWRDVNAGKAELAAVTAVSGTDEAGVRMHWLYYDERSPQHLEAAGFSYDSTWGYNDAVGFRAGTMQPFQLPGTNGLLELPLAIMDTAMLYPGRMALSTDEANARGSAVVAHARRFGGALVVNWHDRSLAPERQWGDCYGRLLDEIESTPVWFATASDAAAWFRWRRSIRFSRVSNDSTRVTVSAPPPPADLPPARLTVHHAGAVAETVFAGEEECVAL
jgi:hypothetical protein